MSQLTLEKRITALEHSVAKLKVAATNGPPRKDWRHTIGMFTGDEVMKRIDKAAREYRMADRRVARRKQAQAPASKP